MTGICKTGLLVLTDSEGVHYYFDPSNSLRDVAHYIFNTSTLNQYKVENNEFAIGASPHKYVEVPHEESHRLRRRFSIRDDPYYSEMP